MKYKVEILVIHIVFYHFIKIDPIILKLLIFLLESQDLNLNLRI